MDLATKARIKSKLAAKGLYWTDAQIEAYAERLGQQPIAPTAQEEPVYPVGMPAAPGGFGDATADLIGNTLWQALDVGTFGLAGWGAKAVAPDLYEDLMDDLEAKGVSGFMLYYGARLPIFGRFYGEVAAATAALSMGKDIPSGFIPAGAFASVIKNAYNIASGIISEDSVSEQEMINAARIFPIVGDTFVRLGIYGAFGDMIEKQNSSSAASTRGSQYHEYQHMGLPPNFGTTSYEAMLAEFYKQLGIEPSWPAYEKNFNNILGTPSARQRRDANSQLLPEEPVTAAETARKPVRQPTGTPQPSTISDPVQGIQEASKALEAPDRLIETD